MSFFSNLYQRYGPFYSQNFVSAQYPVNRNSQNFIYPFILTRSRLELLPVVFCLFVTISLPLLALLAPSTCGLNMVIVLQHWTI